MHLYNQQRFTNLTRAEDNVLAAKASIARRDPKRIINCPPMWLSFLIIVGWPLGAHSDCSYNEVSDAMRKTESRMETGVEKRTVAIRLVTNGEAAVLDDLEVFLSQSPIRRYFKGLSVSGAKSDGIEKEFETTRADILLIVDHEMTMNGIPKYNALLSAFRDEDITTQAFIVDPLPSANGFKPIVSQIASSGDDWTVKYKVEAVLLLVFIPELWNSDNFMSYVGALMEDRQSMDALLDRRTHTIQDCFPN